MEERETYERYVNDENRRLRRVLIFVLVGVALSAILASIFITEIAWVLFVSFLYLLAVELIFFFSSETTQPDMAKPLNQPSNQQNES